MRKRLLAIMTCMVMVLTMVPAVAAYGTSSYDVVVDPCGGTLSLNDGDDSGFYQIPAGEKLGDYLDGLKVEYWTDRELSGWQIGHWVIYENEYGELEDYMEPLESELLTTEELMEYIMPTEEIVIEAVWEGNDNDYYSSVDFDLFGGKIKLSFYGDKPENAGYWWEIMKESDIYNGATVGEQLVECETEFRSEPFNNESGADFEGWMKLFSRPVGDYEVEYEFESEKLYSTEEIMAHEVPEDNVVYVAKWSDTDISEYEDAYLNGEISDDSELNVCFDANGGMLDIDTYEGNITEEVWDFWCLEGDRIGDYITGLGVLVDGEYVSATWDVYNAETGEPVVYDMEGVDVFDYCVNDYSIRLVANWDNGYGYMPYVEFDYNDGEITFGEGDDAYVSDWDWFEITDDATVIDDLIGYDPADVEFWDGKRALKGWDIYTVKATEHEDWIETDMILTEECLTTEEMLAYTLPKNGDSLYVMAVWKGDDLDYKTTFEIDGFGGTMTYVGSDDEGIWTEELSFDRYTLREDKTTVKEQIGIDYMQDPVMDDPDREDAEFEGWLQFNMISVKSGGEVLYHAYELDSEKLYTSAEIMDQKIPHDDVYYAAKWSDMSIDEYESQLNMYDPEYLQVEFCYYDTNGELVYLPMSMKVDGKSTYNQLLDRMSSKIQHMEGLNCIDWEYMGNTGELAESILDEVAVGTWINANAVYDGKGVISVDVNYTDVNGKIRWQSIPVIFNYGDTYQSAYDKASAKFPGAEKHSAACKWTGEWITDEDLSQKIPTDELGIWLDVYAEYEKTNVTIQYTYKTKAGKTKTIVKDESIDQNMTPREYFENLTLPDDAEIPEDGVKWATTYDSYAVDNPAALRVSFEAAVDYEGFDTVFVNRGLVDENCDPCEIYDDVYYVPESLEDQDAVNSYLSAAVTAMDKEYGDSSRDFQLKGYSVYDIEFDPDFEYDELFVAAATYYMEAQYNKALIVLEKTDGTTEKIVKNVDDYYVLPVDGNCDGYWNMTAPFRSGNFMDSGKAVKAKSPYRIFTNNYDVQISDLTAVPENVEMTLDEIKAAMKDASVEAGGIDASKAVIEYKNVQLYEIYGVDYEENDIWKEVNPVYFPSKGINVYLPYPEGTNAKDNDFVVTHMLTSLGEAGEVEVLDVTETEYGLKVKMTSMSPVAIAYEAAEAPVTPDADVERVAGKDRIATAFLAADALKEELGVSEFDNIIVANGLNFPDALAGSYLAAKKNAPILLIYDSAAVKADVTNYIKANLKKDGTVYVLGGEGVVKDEWLAGCGAEIDRLAGAGRYETNLEILKEAGVDSGSDILVCTGTGFADSLSVSATGKPILLVGASLTAEQKAFLDSIEGEKYYLIGGEGAVSKKIEQECKALGKTERVAGNNRFETSIAVAERFFPKADNAVLAYGLNFPDGLSGGPLAYSINGPLILTMDGQENVAAEYTTVKGIETGYVLGGDSLIGEKAVKTIFGESYKF